MMATLSPHLIVYPRVIAAIRCEAIDRAASLRRGQSSKGAKKTVKQTESARPVSTDALASYSQGVSLNKELGYKPQETTSIEQ